MQMLEIIYLFNCIAAKTLDNVSFICLFDGVKRHFQQYFSYIVVASFIGGENH
jgi:hypothetical protein